MGLSFPLLSSVLLMIVVGLNQAKSEPSMYWNKVLPDTPMPNAIKKLLPQVVAMKPVDSENVVDGAINLGRRGVGVNDDKPIAENDKFNGQTLVFVSPFEYDYKVANRKSTTSENAKSNDHAAIPTKLSHAEQLKNDPGAAIFFLRNDLRPGKQSTLQLAERNGRFAPFIPREVADIIPFSESELPSILFRYNIPPSSDEAVVMRNTLLKCETLPVEGEAKRCATSLEAMVDFATIRLGTRDVVPMSMEGEGAYVAEFRTYTVKAVKRVAEAVVAGGKGAVSCHQQPYPYAVFTCHSLTSTEVYSVDLITEDDDDGVATVINLPAICHLDTSRWNPEHISLKALGMEPGEGVVCHFLPQGHVTWVAKL